MGAAISAIPDGVYTVENEGSKSFLTLESGSAADRTNVCGLKEDRRTTSSYNQLWFLEYKANLGYTFRSVRSGSYLDLKGGSTAIGSLVQCCERAPEGSEHHQIWVILGTKEAGLYKIAHRAAAGGATEKPTGGTNDTKLLQTDLVESQNGSLVSMGDYSESVSAAWRIKRRDLTAAEVGTLLQANKYINQTFAHYETGAKYIACPRNVMEDICKKLQEINRKELIAGTYDRDSFVIAMKTAVAEWAYRNVKVERVAVLCGIMYGKGAGAGEGHAYNWIPSQDGVSVRFFDPQTASFVTEIGCSPYFGFF